ncbi:hypothetical protein D038_3784, partial [Vibrio parahaemolyticus IDH02189]
RWQRKWQLNAIQHLLFVCAKRVTRFDKLFRYLLNPKNGQSNHWW